MHCLVVDDEYLPRGGTKMALEAVKPGVKVTEATSLDEAFQVLANMPDVELVVLDLNLGGSRGIDTLKAMIEWCGARDLSPRVVVLSGAGDDNPSLVVDVLENYGTGFILKNTPQKIFQSALTLTLAGGIFIPREILRKLPLPPLPVQPTLGKPSETMRALTSRERQVAKLLIKGWTYKKIAKELIRPDGKRLAEATVRRHVSTIAWKLGVGDGLSPKSGVMAQLAKLGAGIL